MSSVALQAATAVHLLAAAVFVGSNVFLDFVFSRRLELIPPGQAARLGERVGADFALLNWSSLLLLFVSGAVLTVEVGVDSRLLDAGFYVGGYGAALAAMVVLWLTIVASSATLTFYLRPRVVMRLPLQTRILDVEPARARSVALAAWMRRLARYNALASMLAIVAGGSLRWGGFF